MSSAKASNRVRRRIAAQADYRCGYCLTSERLTGIRLTLDHIIPMAAGGLTEENNLWVACRPCNEFKGVQTRAQDPVTGQTVPLFNPRAQLRLVGIRRNDFKPFEREYQIYAFRVCSSENFHQLCVEKPSDREAPAKRFEARRGGSLCRLRKDHRRRFVAGADQCGIGVVQHACALVVGGVGKISLRFRRSECLENFLNLFVVSRAFRPKGLKRKQKFVF